MTDAIDERAIREVYDLHAFFVEWFRAGNAPTPGLARLEDVLAPEFRMVAPDGEAHDRAETIARIAAARATAAGDFSIEILQPCVVWRGDNALLLEYIERQYRDGRETSRRSTGLFASASGTPHGVVWRHLQETWMSAEGRHDGRVG